MSTSNEFRTAHLDQVLVFVLQVSLFSAYRKARTEDIMAAKGVELHPDEVLTLGSQRVFDTERLNVFTRLRDRMTRACDKYGTRFLNGYAVPVGPRSEQLVDELRKLVAEANAQKDQLLRDFDSIMESYCERNPEWETAIRNKAFTADYVRNRVRFGFQAVAVTAAGDAGLAQSLGEQVDDLQSEVMRGISISADDYIGDTLAGRQVLGQKALRPLKAMSEKLRSFDFMDARFGAVAEMIDEVVASLPGTGSIVGAEVTKLWSLASLLKDPRAALSAAAQYVSGQVDQMLQALSASTTTAALGEVLDVINAQVVGVPVAGEVAAEVGQAPSQPAQTPSNDEAFVPLALEGFDFFGKVAA